MLVEIIIALLALTVAIFCYLTRHFDYWKKMGVPSDKPLPFFGSRKAVILMKSHECVDTDRIYRQFPDEPVVGLFEGDQPVLLVRDPTLVRQLFANESEMRLSRRFHQNEGNPFTNSLLFAHGECWKNLRTMMSPCFTTRRVKSALGIFLRNIDEMKRSLMSSETGGVVLEVGDVASRYSMDNMASWVFGLDVSSVRDPDNEFRRMFLDITGPGATKQLRRMMGWIFRSLLALLPVNYSFPGREISQFMNQTVDRVSHSHSDDLVHSLLNLRGREILPVNELQTKPMIMTTDLVAANAFLVFLAGSDTSSSAISFCLLELALNHDIQSKLYDEIKAETQQNHDYEPHDDDDKFNAVGFTNESLKVMKYLDKVIAETLRKWPPGVAVGRETTARTVFPGTKVVLQRGTGILIPIWSIQRDEKFYPDPEKFDPERFSDEAKALRVPGTYLPFSDGGHICIGMQMGLLQVKVAVASIVRDYTVETCEKTLSPAKPDPTAFINAQQGGTWLKLVRRSS